MHDADRSEIWNEAVCNDRATSPSQIHIIIDAGRKTRIFAGAPRVKCVREDEREVVMPLSMRRTLPYCPNFRAIIQIEAMPKRYRY